MAPQPTIQGTKNDNFLGIWNLHGDSLCCEHQNLCQHQLSHEKIFYSTKKEWRYNRDYDHFNAIDEDQLLKSKPKRCNLPNARNIFIPFAALEGKRTVMGKELSFSKNQTERGL